MKFRPAWMVTTAVLAGITIVNVTLAARDSRPPEQLPPWEFVIGDAFPESPFRVPAASPAAGTEVDLTDGVCRLVVIFDTRCGHCHTAKLIEASVPDSLRLPVAWLSRLDDEAAARFADGLSPTSRVLVFDPARMGSMVVRATPIAFLVAPSGRVRHISPYEGTTAQHTAMRRACVER